MDWKTAAKEKFPTNILVALVLGLIVGYFIATYVAGSSGQAAKITTRQTVLNELNEAIPKFDIINNMGDFTACLIVNMPKEKYSYQINRVYGTISIEISDNWQCDGMENEDFIISYVSYSRLQTHLHLIPGFLALRSANSMNFYIFPSKQIAEGFTLANPDEFQQRFPELYSLITQ